MIINCEMRRFGDKVRAFEFKFPSEIIFKDFMYDFLKHDELGEKLELRIWKG